jgi:hypothetical protein
MSKIVHYTTFPLWSESPDFTICSLSSQVKSGPKMSLQTPNSEVKRGEAELALSN